MLLLPAVIYLLIFNYAPMFGIQIAFRDYKFSRGFFGSEWVGLKHFTYFFHSVQFKTLIINTVKLSVYMKFLEGLRTGRLISEKTLDLMTQNQISVEQRAGYADEKYGYGLGVRCPSEAAGTTDFGWGGAAGAYAVVDRSHEMSAFYAQHILNLPNDDSRRELPGIILEAISLL